MNSFELLLQKYRNLRMWEEKTRRREKGDGAYHPGHLSEHEADTMINQLCKIVEDLTIIVDKHQAIEHSVSSLWKSAKELSGIFPQGKEDTWEYEEGRDETT